MAKRRMADARRTRGELKGKGDGDSSSLAESGAAPPEEPVQETANNEKGETNVQQSSPEEDRKKFIKERELRERRLGLLQSYPIIWIGDLLFKDLKIRVAIKYIYGYFSIFKESVPPSTVGYSGFKLKWDQKFDTALQDLQQTMGKRRICVLLAVPLDVEQRNRLKEKLIPYFQNNKRVLVSNFPSDGVLENLDFEESGSSRQSVTSTTNRNRNLDFGISGSSWPFVTSTINRNKVNEMKVFSPSECVYQNLLLTAPTLAKNLYREECPPHLLLVMRRNISPSGLFQIFS